MIPSSLTKDGGTEEHVHRAAIPPQGIQTSDGDYGSELVELPQGSRPRVRREQSGRWFIRDMKMFRPRRESADIRFRCNTKNTRSLTIGLSPKEQNIDFIDRCMYVCVCIATCLYNFHILPPRYRA